MEGLPIALVTFDLYDTLIELHPQRWERLHRALQRLGLTSDLARLREVDRDVEDFYTAENTIQPIRDRTQPEREAFRLQYMANWLAWAGVDADSAMIRAARQEYISEYETPAQENPLGYGYRVFADVVPALQRLKAAGVQRAVISNADDDVTELCQHMAFAHEMDLIVTSALVGYEKPDVRTFRAALDPLGVQASQALHIGDQPRSDVVGAHETGMQAALIDRYSRHDPDDHAVPIFIGLDALVDHVLTINSGVLLP